MMSTKHLGLPGEVVCEPVRYLMSGTATPMLHLTVGSVSSATLSFQAGSKELCLVVKDVPASSSFPNVLTDGTASRC